MEDNQEPDIPQAMCVYKDQEYSLTPHIFNDGEKSSRITFPQLPDDHAPQMTVQLGEELTMEFDGDKQPNEMQALLVDYDADVTETYPLNKIDDNKFEITQPGIKTLEVIASFPDGEPIRLSVSEYENISKNEVIVIARVIVPLISKLSVLPLFLLSLSTLLSE